MKRLGILLILTVCLIGVFTSPTKATSTAGVLYLRVAPGARPAGMGECFVSIADDASATYWNPAGLGNEPLSGQIRHRTLAGGRGEIIDAVTLERDGTRQETWVISDNRLYLFDGMDWTEGHYYRTSSDQTLDDFLQSIIKIDDPEQLKEMATTVITVNCPVTEDEVLRFIERITEKAPEGYPAKDDLERGLEKLRAGFYDCRLNAEHFRELQKRLNEGLADDLLTEEETDRFTFSLDRSVMRFLPTQLTVPFSAGITGQLSCLGSSGKYLWVGTDDGLYRRSGQTWSRFSTDNTLPSDTILTMDQKDEYLYIGTKAGLAVYYHGNFTTYEYLPAGPVEAIYIIHPNLVWAAIDGYLYKYDGRRWEAGYDHKVLIDDKIDDLIAPSHIFGDAEETKDLRYRVREINPDVAPPLQPEPAVEEVLETNDSTDVIGDEEADSIMEENLQEDAEPAVEEEIENAAIYDDSWLTDGVLLRIPFGPKFRFPVKSMAMSKDSILYVGTEQGLYSFDGTSWKIHGYDKYRVPEGSDDMPGTPMTALEIARLYQPAASEETLNLLAENIDRFNNLEGQPVNPGQSIWVYNSNVGSAIYSLNQIGGEFYAGTEFGMMKLTNKGWVKANMEHTYKARVVSMYDYKNKSYFITETGILSETEGKTELVLMHVDWLPSFDLDMYYEFLSLVHHVRGVGTFGLNVIYLNYGQIQFTDSQGNDIDAENPFEVTAGISYGTSITESLKFGLGAKIIHSHLSSIGTAEEIGNGIATTVAFDLGILWKITDRFQLGSAATNIGPDITYVNAAQNDPLPRNFSVGLSYKILNSPYNKFIVQTEMNHLLVSGEGTIWHVGGEYNYANIIMLRGGYKHDKEGEVKHLTFGAGLHLSPFRFDFAYVPSTGDSPLSNTLRISLTLNL